MRSTPTLSSPSILAALSGWIGLFLCVEAHAAADVATAGDEAMAACEQTARSTLAARAAHAAEVTFNAAPSVDQSLSNERQIVLSGEGRWRAAGGVRHVRFTCNVDRRTFETLGLVIRDTTPAVAKAAAPVRRPAEPDLSHLSMASCESSAVLALQKRWPRVSQISFDSDTRSFRQDSLDRAELRGHGRALPVQGAPSTFFGFECEIDPQDGRVLRARVSG